MASVASLLTTASASGSSKPLISSGTNTPKSAIVCQVRQTSSSSNAAAPTSGRRELLVAGTTASVLALQQLLAVPAARADDEEYVKDTTEVIAKLRTTINMPKGDPGVADAVAELREASNAWVAKFRRERALLGRASFRDIYSALNAVSGHYVSFGPTAPIPAKRKARILEEVDTAEKALQRGR